MQLGLFNWTSDLSDEPEYPPVFNLFSAAVGADVFTRLGRCLVDVIYGNERQNVGGGKVIGMIEYMGGDIRITGIEERNFDTLTKRFGEEGWLELANAFSSRGIKLYDILRKPVFILFQSPEDFPKSLLDSDYEWSDDKDTFASNDFYYWPSYNWWICINPKWNAKLVEILKRKNPDVMEDFAKCCWKKIGLEQWSVGMIKNILRDANLPTSGKKADLIQRVIDFVKL
tara:strand:+ start:1735 stop:2418 length:684 start_codon:yes stop_codon:yes gene_type:complete